MKAKWNYSDLRPIILEAKKNLPRSDERFSTRGFVPSMAISQTTIPPSDTEMLYSERGFLCGNEQVEADFNEEISQIEKLLRIHEVPLVSRRKGTCEASQKLVDAVNRRSHAINIWTFYAIPWRFDGDLTHIIDPPQDINGSPVIRSLKTSDFIESHLTRLSEAESEICKLRNKYAFWQAATIFLIIAGIVFFQWN